MACHQASNLFEKLMYPVLRAAQEATIYATIYGCMCIWSCSFYHPCCLKNHPTQTTNCVHVSDKCRVLGC